jgi:RND family efflux transporter MFP subunit
MLGSAPVYSLADEQRTRVEAAAWSQFVAAEDDATFCAAWLALLAAHVERARAALLLLADEQGQTFGVAAVWPDPRRDVQYLGPVAQRALGERAGVVASPQGGDVAPDGPAHVAYPIEVAGRLHAVVAFDVGSGPQAALQAALRQIHWAAAWLVDRFRQRIIEQRDAELARVGLLNELMATALQHPRLAASALAVANELAGRLRCDRVSIGFEDHGEVEPKVMSHTATFDRRSDLVRALAGAMEEVLDLGVAVRVPVAADDELGAIAHAETARALGVACILSVPLTAQSQTVGVLTLERTDGPPFDASEERIARALGVMLGPVWALQRARELPWWRRVRERSRSALQATLGPRRPGLKLLAGASVVLVAALALIEIDHRVSARTVIEGSVQRASVAPFDGYVAEAFVRAGDTVRAGQPMARLDDRDLKLERARWSAEREQLQRKHQVAMAQADRSAMGVIAAQIGQADAQLALAQEKLDRATLVAPFDGVVVSGDLSQTIGSPVEQGKVLFEVAPLEGYRVILQVDDRDIARVATEQHGELVLSGLPHDRFPFAVSTVTPVATQVEGRNVFRVEARIEGPRPRLRPGMEGIGKVVVGQRSLLWVWTHTFFDWLRLALWNWMP